MSEKREAEVLQMQTSEVTDNLQMLALACPELVGVWLSKLAQRIVALAKERAPIEHGPLRASIRWDALDSNTIIIYSLSAYAAAQHENLEYKHIKGGEAKFLESALVEVGTGSMPRELMLELIRRINSQL